MIILACRRDSALEILQTCKPPTGSSAAGLAVALSKRLMGKEAAARGGAAASTNVPSRVLGQWGREDSSTARTPNMTCLDPPDCVADHTCGERGSFLRQKRARR